MDDMVVPARKIAFLAFQLDDPGARFGQPRGAERRVNRLFQLDD